MGWDMFCEWSQVSLVFAVFSFVCGFADVSLGSCKPGISWLSVLSHNKPVDNAGEVPDDVSFPVCQGANCMEDQLSELGALVGGGIKVCLLRIMDCVWPYINLLCLYFCQKLCLHCLKLCCFGLCCWCAHWVKFCLYS